MSIAAIAATVVIGATGAVGPTSARQPLIAPGHMKVVICTTVTGRTGHPMHSVTHCRTTLVSGTIRVATAS